MKSYKGFSVLLLSANMCLAEVTGVAFCELEHSESQAYTLRLLQNTYRVENCEALFLHAQTLKGINFDSGRSYSDNKMTDITPICAMRHITTISLGDVAIDDFSCLADMKLKQLRIDNWAPVDMQVFSGQTTLEYLVLRTKDLMHFPAISTLTRLEYLDLAGNKGITDTRPLSSLTNLTELILRGNPLENLEGLSGLTKLSNLDLSRTTLNDADLEHLRPLVNLGSLDLYKNNLTDISALEDLTNLWQLIISQNQIVDLSPLVGMKRLKVLKANDNQIEDITPISQLPSLETIEIRHNRIRDTSPLVVNLPRLATLTATHNPLYDCAPAIRWGNNAKVELCTAADIERLSNPGIWQRIKNVFN